MNSKLTGLHHITAICSDVRRNMLFYTQVLGLRFVKKSVNQDDTSTYHLYYGNYTGAPGTALTFFPWSGLPRGRPGTGQAYATAFSIGAHSIPFWQERLTELKVMNAPLENRWGETVLPFMDHDGLRLELIATNEVDERPPAPSLEIPAAHAIRGFHGSTLALHESGPTAAVLENLMGYRLVAHAGHRARYTVAASGPGTYVDLLTDPALPRGMNGAGTIHHIAFRTPDEVGQSTARQTLLQGALQVSPVIDRAYFKSIYYREPGGVLFEIATDQPGFAIDEPVETLGTKLSLPPHLEPYRSAIASSLPALS